VIFSGGLHELVLDGRKTVTRRPVREGVPCQYVEGRDYAVQPGRGKFSQGRIRVLLVSREPVGDVDDDDARAEGFEDAEQFFEKWEQLYGAGFDPMQPVWRIEFVLVAGSVVLA
jgi:hypothetical protein